MKTKYLALAVAALSTANFQPSTASAQGSLTPPGAPAPTMKTLAQIEPRTPITTNTTPGDANNLFIISQPGSYYLTTNIIGVAAKQGIAINASGVTLDLMGFELAGVAGSLNGATVVGVSTRVNLSVRNGTVRNWGGHGVNTVSANNAQYQDLRLSANGGIGLNCGPNSTVVNCTVLSNGSDGIAAADGSVVSGCAAQSNTGNGISTTLGCTVSGCSAVANTLHGISAGSASTVNGCTVYSNLQRGINMGDGCTAKDCTARSNGTDGIFTADDCTVTSCTARRNDGRGIFADTGNTVSECTVAFNGADGIDAASDCQIRHNNSRQNGRLIGGGTGILTSGANNRIDENNVTANVYGIACYGAGNIVIRNTARGNTTANYLIGTGNGVGVTGVAPDGHFTGSAGGAGVGSTDPWANISY